MIHKILNWLLFRRCCKWCNPPHWMGGAPWGRVTHGICEAAFKREMEGLR